jgi:hypothetical protein
MTVGTLNNPQVGDLVMNWDGEIGIISLIEHWSDENGQHLYFVHWSSGYLTGYSTAHKRKEIEGWTRNVRLNT